MNKKMTDGTILNRLCGNIAADRFNWRRYLTPQTYFGREICVQPIARMGKSVTPCISRIPTCRKWNTIGN